MLKNPLISHRDAETEKNISALRKQFFTKKKLLLLMVNANFFNLYVDDICWSRDKQGGLLNSVHGGSISNRQRHERAKSEERGKIILT
ncbi:MAG: hypothetical protein KJ985_00360 [Proteobacteria bacterium]|nr:hypothetical protein [Pseudomonadota bacterium]